MNIVRLNEKLLLLPRCAEHSKAGLTTLRHTTKGLVLAAHLQQRSSALVLAIAPKEQSNGTCAVTCRRASARGDKRRETYPGEERALQNTFVWISPGFQPLESGDFYIDFRGKRMKK